ncbi:MAG: diguanylate cyclase [Clostridia bacterium]|nr:diguanylate cyclase [Clostridia bacterium]
MPKEFFAVTVDLTSLAFMLVLFCAAFVADRRNRSGSRHLFLTMTATWILALITDTFAWSTDLSPALTAADWFFGVFSCCFAEIEATLFIFYLLTLTRERGRDVKRTLGHAAVIINGIGIALTVFFAVIGKLYTAEGGKLLPGNHYFIVGLSPILTVTGLLIFVLSKWSTLGKRIVATTVIYVLLPLAGYILEVFVLEWFPASMCMNSMALLIVYIMLQANEINATHERERILRELSTVHVMTGLNNRRVYHERIIAVRPDERLCVIFSDVNALKYTNDNFGHEAGDQLLKDYAAMISDHFGKENVYRISGDEFVVIFNAEDTAAADAAVAAFRGRISRNESVASVGAAIGYGKEINRILDEAEKRMYADKDLYYERTGKPRRR